MWALLPVGAFILVVIAHAVLCRLPLRTDFVVKSLVVGIPTGVALTAVMVSRFGWRIETFAALLLFAFFCEFYIFCFTLVSTSVSVSILLKVSDHTLRPEEIEARYSDKSMVEGRVEKLLRARFLTRHEDGARVTEKARVLLVVFRTLRFFFRHPSASTTQR